MPSGYADFVQSLLWISLIPMLVVTIPSLVFAGFFGYSLLRFVKALERKWDREGANAAARVEAEKLNRPFTSDDRRYQPRQ